MQTGDGTDMVVYVVDDVERVRDGFARLLRSAGLQPKPYACAEVFLKDVCNAPYTCILLDITMPKMSGMQVLERLMTQGISVPVISFSAHDGAAIRERARRLGARIFLSKPVDDQALLDAISWVTGKSPKRH